MPFRIAGPVRSAAPLLAALAWVTACTRPVAEVRAPSRADRHPHSNILRTDYAGSAACAPCHPAVYQAWQSGPMHNMTRLPATAKIRAPFDGTEVRYKADAARLFADGGERFVQLRSAQAGDHLFRVTKVIGGRYREDFAGLEVPSTAAGAPVIGDPHAEQILPLSYVFETESFRLKGYSVMVTERPGLRAGGVWNQTCVLCHNTYPLFGSLWGALHGPGAPTYQGETVDRVLPIDRRWSWKITDASALNAALRSEIHALGDQPPPSEDTHASLAWAAHVLRDRLAPETLVEVGIGCESCHGGSREHVEQNHVLPSFEPRSTFLAPRPAQPGVTTAEWINRACARCHQVLFSRYPYTWEGGLRRRDPGGSHITSGEAHDFLLGGCARQMSCTTCHDPHGADDPAKLRALATPAGNPVCTGCHTQYAATPALRAHAHHDPAGAAGSCVACHMPRKNMGLGYALTRYHRIGSPTDRARVEGDRPLECALCHPRARVEELVDRMESWWGKRYDRARLTALYGSMDAPVLGATLARGKPHEQATAIAVLGDAKEADATPALAAALAHPYPLVRYYARRALEQARGAPVPVDLEQDADAIRAGVSRWLGTTVPAPTGRVPRPSPVDDED
jgi:predicted CXXCH cytochrome family protein